MTTNILNQLKAASGVAEDQITERIEAALPAISARLVKHARPGVVLCIIGVVNAAVADALAARLQQEGLTATVVNGSFYSTEIHVKWSRIEGYCYSGSDFSLDVNLNIVERKP